MAAKTMQECQDQIMELRRRISDAGSVYNSGAAINEKLPSEGFLQIFRYVTPSYVDLMAPIRLTHVCRAWRTLIHRSPVFWMDILDPVPDSEVKASFTNRAVRFPIVLTAFEKSQPAPSLRFTLHWAFLPTLVTIPSHVSRISTLLWLRLDCSCSNDTVCGLLRHPTAREADVVVASFALQQVTPQLRILICASRNREGEAYAHITRYCCRNDILPRVLKALERCADEELELDLDIPGAGAGIPDLRLPRLSSLHLGGTLEVVRAVFEHLDIRDTTRITLYTDHLPTADLLPRRNLSAVIPGIRSLAIYVHSACILNHFGSFDGEIECGDRRLSLHFEHPSFDRPRPAVQRFDLRVFFQGESACFSPSAITHLSVVSSAYLLKSNAALAWSWLFQHHGGVTDLVLDVRYAREALSALMSAGVLMRLERLTAAYDLHERKLYYTSIAALGEQRAYRRAPAIVADCAAEGRRPRSRGQDGDL